MTADVQILTSYHCLQIQTAQPDPVTSLKPLASRELQTDSWRPAGTAHRKKEKVLAVEYQDMTGIWQVNTSFPITWTPFLTFLRWYFIDVGSAWMIIILAVWWWSHLLVGIVPVWTRDVSQVSSVLYLIVSDLLVLQPHNAVPELGLIWTRTRITVTARITYAK